MNPNIRVTPDDGKGQVAKGHEIKQTQGSIQLNWMEKFLFFKSIY